MTQALLDFLSSLTPLTAALTAVLLAVALFYLYYYLRYLTAPLRSARKQKALNAGTHENAGAHDLPPVSVIVCARNEADNLRHYLQALCSQDYPAFEVIVVNDESQDDTQTVLEQLAKRFRDLRLTFVPQQARVTSSKKLAITLAVKAAKYDYLLLTDADCRPESPHWIRDMMRGFDNPQTEVVLGYGGYFRGPGTLNHLIQYDTLTRALTFLGAAIAGHPYMGVGRNLAYKKSTFFAHNGFAGQLNHTAGDDDLFVAKVANRHNTAVVLTPDAFTWSLPKTTYREWTMQKRRHLSVAPAYRFATKLRLAAEPVARLILYCATIAVVVLALTGMLAEPMVWAGAVAIFVLRLLALYCIVNRAARVFRLHRFSLGQVLAFDIFLPLTDLTLIIRNAFRRPRPGQW